ncbi:MAG: hypothetical protein EOP84_13775 [Verrucomicrobiaceae bacterium]|nr:MAG: hypothetical protein EOP84_13775 [Verrucomicrobiaceae bacterium]
MKFRNKMAFLGMAVLTVMTVMTAGISSSQAAVVAQPSDGDLFLGFRATSGSGSSYSYVVNLGQYSAFSGQAPGSTVSLSGIGDIGADLVAIFGAGWNTSGDVKWGLFGRDDTGTVALYASKEQEVVGVTGDAYATRTLSQRQSTSSRVGTVIYGINGFNGSQSTLNSTVAVRQENVVSGTPNQASYNYQVTNGVTDFGTVSGWTDIEGDFGNGVSGTALDLFRISSAGVTSPGFFSIGSGGSLSFTSVPEPSAALVGAAGALVLLTRRRRLSASA